MRELKLNKCDLICNRYQMVNINGLKIGPFIQLGKLSKFKALNHKLHTPTYCSEYLVCMYNFGQNGAIAHNFLSFLS